MTAVALVGHRHVGAAARRGGAARRARRRHLPQPRRGQPTRVRRALRLPVRRRPRRRDRAPRGRGRGARHAERRARGAGARVRRARPPRVRREADRRHARGRRADAPGLRRRRRGADGRARLPPARRRAARQGAARRRRPRRVVLAEANMSLPGTFKPEAWRAQRAATRAGRSCSSASTTSTRSPTGSGRCGARRAASRMCTPTADIDDVGVVTLEFESGALGSLTGSYVSPKTLSLRLLGTDAVLDYRTDFSVWPDAGRSTGSRRSRSNGEPVEFEERDMLAEELAEFGRCIRGEAEPETGADEGIAALAVVLEALGTPAEATASCGPPWSRRSAPRRRSAESESPSRAGEGARGGRRGVAEPDRDPRRRRAASAARRAAICPWARGRRDRGRVRPPAGRHARPVREGGPSGLRGARHACGARGGAGGVARRAARRR